MNTQTPLTDEQVARLFAFCREHYVTYYDVQVELVDHMAAAIEDRWKIEPGLTFEQALQTVFAGFGYKGFSSVVEARTKQVQAANRRLVWPIFIAYFSWPKAMLTLLVLTVLYVLQYYCPLVVLKWITGIAIICLFTAEGFIWCRQWLRYHKPTTPLLLLQRGWWPFALTSAGLLNLYFNVFRGFRWLDDGRRFSLFTYDAFIIFFVLMLALVLAVYDTKKKIYYMAREKYPAAFTIPDTA